VNRSEVSPLNDPKFDGELEQLLRNQTSFDPPQTLPALP
jgi:hypothetical protein